MPLVGAGIGVEHDHPAVAVAVRHEHFVRRRVDGNARGLVDVLRVVASAGLAVLPDLEQELSGVGELQDVRVLVAVPRQPHVVFVIDVDAVFDVGPVVALSRTTPRLEQVPRLIEFQDRRRRRTAIGRLVAEVFVVLVGRARTMDHPDVVVGIDVDARHLSQQPVVRQMLGPGRVGFELRQRAAAPTASPSTIGPAKASAASIFTVMSRSPVALTACCRTPQPQHVTFLSTRNLKVFFVIFVIFVIFVVHYPFRSVLSMSCLA